jgi:hypothetical protein
VLTLVRSTADELCRIERRTGSSEKWGTIDREKEHLLVSETHDM